MVPEEQSTKKTMTEEPPTLTLNLDTPIEDMIIEVANAVLEHKEVLMEEAKIIYEEEYMYPQSKMTITGVSVRTYKLA